MEGTVKKKYSVKLNNADKIEQLLQEVYDLACQQNKQLEDEKNKMANTTILKDLDIDGKEKYGKIMTNYFTLQQKINAQKQDIAKLMTEVLKHNGDVKGAVDSMQAANTTLDLNKLRQLAKDANTPQTTTEVYQTNR